MSVPEVDITFSEDWKMDGSLGMVLELQVALRWRQIEKWVWKIPLNKNVLQEHQNQNEMLAVKYMEFSRWQEY